MSLLKAAGSAATAIFLFYAVIFFHVYTHRILRSISGIITILYTMLTIVPLLGQVFQLLSLDFILKLIFLICGGFGATIGITPVYLSTRGVLDPLNSGALLFASLFCAMQSGSTLLQLGFVSKSIKEIDAVEESGDDNTKFLLEWMSYTHKRLPDSDAKMDIIRGILNNPETKSFILKKIIACCIIDRYLYDFTAYLSSISLLILACERLGLFKTQSGFFALFDSVQCSLSLFPSSPVECLLVKNQAWSLIYIMLQFTIFIFISISISSVGYELANNSAYRRFVNKPFDDANVDEAAVK